MLNNASDKVANWQFEKEKKGIKVYTREVDGFKIREYRAVTKMRTTVNSLVALYLDADKCVYWVPDCKASHVLSKNGQDTFNLYREINNPWPFKNMDYVLEVSVQQDDLSGSVLIAYHDVKDLMPQSACCNRMKMIKGYWRFTPVEEGYVKITYQNHFLPAGKVPASLINSALPNFPIEMLTKLQKLLVSTTG